MPFKWHAGEANRLLHSTSGPTGRMLARYGALIETAAKARCPVDTGRLRGSINWRLEFEGELAVIIGTNVEYAVFVHQGTRYMPGRPFLVEGMHQVLGR